MIVNREYFVYFPTNKTNTVLYIGVTNQLSRRIAQHRNEMVEGFSKTYHTHKLIYYESFFDVNNALTREKQLKRWTRAKKDALVNAVNPMWEDLSDRFSDADWQS